ncbi:MAG: DUF1801 domain-containing protein [Siphonobacter aquaeclarae]|nr:DUF1801 domain-containing protein [Siphonobacter aquaeclarae]
MAKNKTTETNASVEDFLQSVSDETRRNDGRQLLAWMEELSGFPAKLWGPSIIGFGSYHYKYASGHEGDMPLIGFSPRKDSQVLYLFQGFPEWEELLARLGKHKTSKACLYIKKLSDIDIAVLKQLITESLAHSSNG